MEMIKRLNNQLRHPGWLLYGMVVLFLLVIVGPSAKLVCERTRSDSTVNCIREKRLFWVIPMGTSSIRDVQGAEITGTDSDYGPVYRVELLTAQGNIPINSVYTSGYSSKEHAADKINSFVELTDKNELVVTEPGLLSFENLVWLAIGLMAWLFWKWIKSGSDGTMNKSINSVEEINNL